MDGPAIKAVIDELKRLEHEGYHFEAADASLELLMRRATGWQQEYFRVESMRVITDEVGDAAFSTEATVKVWVGDERYVFTAEGNGPVNAIDTALRRPCRRRTRSSASVHLIDFKVRILDGGEATGAVTRVLLTATNGDRRVDDDRRQPEHHRSVVAGARGEPRSVRLAATAGLTVT